MDGDEGEHRLALLVTLCVLRLPSGVYSIRNNVCLFFNTVMRLRLAQGSSGRRVRVI